MTSIFETLHPRAAAGRFTDKVQSAPETALTASVEPTGQEHLASLIGERPLAHITPEGVTKTRAALRNARGVADGGIRVVSLDWRSIPAASDAGDLEVIGPKDGRPLIVHIFSGFPAIRVKSGHVVVVAESYAGHSLHFGDGSTGTVIGGDGRKVSITANAGSTVDYFAGADSRGLQAVDPFATLNVRGPNQDVSVHARALEASR